MEMAEKLAAWAQWREWSLSGKERKAMMYCCTSSFIEISLNTALEREKERERVKRANFAAAFPNPPFLSSRKEKKSFLRPLLLLSRGRAIETEKLTSFWRYLFSILFYFPSFNFECGLQKVLMTW